MKRSLAPLALLLFIGSFSAAKAEPLAITGGQFYVISGPTANPPAFSNLVGPELNARVGIGFLGTVDYAPGTLSRLAGSYNSSAGYQVRAPLSIAGFFVDRNLSGPFEGFGSSFIVPQFVVPPLTSADFRRLHLHSPVYRDGEHSRATAGTGFHHVLA